MLFIHLIYRIQKRRSELDADRRFNSREQIAQSATTKRTFWCFASPRPYVAVGVSICKPCGILALDQQGPFEIKGINGGKAQSTCLGMPKIRERKWFQQFIATRRRWRGSRAQLVMHSVSPVFICACIQRIRCIPLH